MAPQSRCARLNVKNYQLGSSAVEEEEMEELSIPASFSRIQLSKSLRIPFNQENSFP